MWFICFVSFIELVLVNETDEQQNKRDEPHIGVKIGRSSPRGSLEMRLAGTEWG